MGKLATKYYVPEWINKNSIVVDAGGYLGGWAEYIVKSKGAKVYIFEPYPANIDALHLKFVGNKNVELLDIALASSDGSRPLYLAEGTDGMGKYWPEAKGNSHSFFNSFGEKARYLDAQTMSLNTFVDKYDIEVIHLLKLNIEGAEVEVLGSITKELAARILCICFSLHEEHTDEVCKAVLMNHLQAVGYDISLHIPADWAAENEDFRRYICKFS
jgi:FkbM family methyltransferase